MFCRTTSRCSAADVQRPGSIFHECHGLAAPTATAVIRQQVELVDKSVAAQPLQAVAEGNHDVAHRFRSVENEPGATEVGVTQ